MIRVWHANCSMIDRREEQAAYLGMLEETNWRHQLTLEPPAMARRALAIFPKLPAALIWPLRRRFDPLAARLPRYLVSAG